MKLGTQALDSHCMVDAKMKGLAIKISLVIPLPLADPELRGRDRGNPDPPGKSPWKQQVH